jgi:hypothetical protein
MTRCWLLLLLLISTPSFAESQTFGEYTVHYIAVNSTFLTPEIAAQYKIVRSKRRAFLNIAVLRNKPASPNSTTAPNNPNGSTTPVNAVLSGGKRNLMQQSNDIPFAEIREGEAIYYIGQFDFSNAETLRFAVAVQPEGKGKKHLIEWTTQLFAD